MESRMRSRLRRGPQRGGRPARILQSFARVRADAGSGRGLAGLAVVVFVAAGTQRQRSGGGLRAGIPAASLPAHQQDGAQVKRGRGLACPQNRSAWHLANGLFDEGEKSLVLMKFSPLSIVEFVANERLLKSTEAVSLRKLADPRPGVCVCVVC